MMGCKYAAESGQYHGWECTVTGGECAFLTPNSRLCADEYGEGPDADTAEKAAREQETEDAE